MLFIRGNAVSGAPIISGTNQFPKPPITNGITMKKIVTNAWAVTTHHGFDRHLVGLQGVSSYIFFNFCWRCFQFSGHFDRFC